MRSSVLIILATFAAAPPAEAQLTTFYRGTERMGDKEVPATAQFSIEKGRAAMVMKGSRAARMLFVEKSEVLRIVDDTGGSYFDLGKATAGSGPTEMMAELKEQLDQLPPEQRKMAEESMKGALGSAKPPPPTEYVWTKEKKSIAGYECTRVDLMRGSDKRGEYWGTTSKDFRMSDAERKTMLAMQEYLRNFLIMVRPAGAGAGGEGTRAFQWDTSVDGYPIVTRCFDGGKMTLDLTLESFNRNAVSKDLFEVPSSYSKYDLPEAEHTSGKGKHR